MSSNIKNVKICNPAGGNTRVGSCWNDIGIPRGILIGPLNTTFDASTLVALKAVLEPLLLADNPYGRIYPLQNIVVPTDQTKAPDVITFAGNGQQIIASENARSMTFQWYDGGYCLLRALRTANGQNRGIMVIDSKGQLLCTDAGGNLVKFISAYTWAKQFKWPMTTSEVAAYEFFTSFETSQIDDSGVIIDFNVNGGGGLGYLTNLQGLYNVGITQAAAPSSTTVSVKAQVTGCGSADMYDLYADALAVVGAWKVTRADTGGTIVVSAVTKSATFNGWVLTLTSATGLTVNVSLVGPTELAALSSPVAGYESNQLLQIIP